MLAPFWLGSAALNDASQVRGRSGSIVEDAGQAHGHVHGGFFRDMYSQHLLIDTELNRHLERA